MKPRRDILKYTAAIPAVFCSALLGETLRRKPIKSTPPKYLILTCDGGGIRGYLSSLLLQRLNQDLAIFGLNNEQIDLYAGTSTGGLIALSLAQGKSIDSVVTLYKESGAEIFSPLKTQPLCLFSETDGQNTGAVGLQGISQVIFDNIGDPSLLTLLKNFIPENPLLSSLTNKVMVATFQLAAPELSSPNWRPLVIDNLNGSPGAETRLYDAALSTAAAPVYFPPYHHPQFGWCCDGGLFANNPSVLALGRAIESGQALSDIAVLSIGTGATNASLPVTDANRLCFGVSHWADLKARGPTPSFPLLNGIMDSVSVSADYLCGQFLRRSQESGRYMRVNPVLPRPVALDDYSPATMRMLEETAEAYVASSEWQALRQWITNTFHK